MKNSITKSGNKCQHQKLNPQWFIPPVDHKSRYDAIEKAKANCQQFYWFPTKWLKALHNKRESLMRSELREALVLFVQVLLHYTHLSNLTVAVPNNGRFRPMALKDLAAHAGISFRRAIRVQNVLIAAGYLTVKKRREFKNGKFIGLRAIRIISEKLFFDLGVIVDNLKSQRGKATYRLNKTIKEFEKQMREQTFKNVKEKGKAWLKLALNHLKNLH